MKHVQKPLICFGVSVAAAAIMTLMVLANPLFASDVPVPKKRPAVDGASSIAEDQSGSANPSPAAFDQDCEAAMSASAITFKRLAPIAGDEGCKIAAPYEISTLSPGIELVPAVTVTCETAIAFNNWVNEAVVPYSARLGQNVKLSTIRTASSYVCRGRNNDPNARISEHAVGRALDIAAFGFSGHPAIVIEPRQRTGSMAEAFQKAVRFAACLHFTTVLGPFSDSHHNDHLHLDLAPRSNGYRLCDLPDLPDKKN